MTPDGIPPTAAAIIEATAQEYDVEAIALFAPWPERKRTPAVERAREAAIGRLADERLDEKPRYGIGEIAAWFGTARQRINVHRRKASDYQPRFSRRPLTA